MAEEEQELETYLALAKECAIEAGKIIKEAWGKKKNVQYKAPTDLLTETDQQCEQLIMSKISSRYPSHKFIAEETVSSGKGREELSDEPTWIIDPLDGTINFVHGIPWIAVSIGFAVKKQVKVGVVYNPILDELFTAARGKGAFLNGSPIHSSQTKDLKAAVVAIACGAEIPTEDRNAVLKNLDFVIQNCRTWRRGGSAALDCTSVAMGRADLYIEKGIHAWDIAAGVVIIQEAGGVVSDLKGGELDVCSRQILTGANATLHSLLLEGISKS